MSTPIPPKVKGIVLVGLVVFLGGAWVKDEIHNHTPQGRYEICVRQGDLDAHRAGTTTNFGNLAVECEQQTGYHP